MSLKTTYTLETFTLVRETRKREDGTIIALTVIMPDNFVVTHRFNTRVTARENEREIILFLEKTFDMKPYFKGASFEEKLDEFDEIRLKHQRSQYDQLMDELLNRTGALKEDE